MLIQESCCILGSDTSLRVCGERKRARGLKRKGKSEKAAKKRCSEAGMWVQPVGSGPCNRLRNPRRITQPGGACMFLR